MRWPWHLLACCLLVGACRLTAHPLLQDPSPSTHPASLQPSPDSWPLAPCFPRERERRPLGLMSRVLASMAGELTRATR